MVDFKVVEIEARSILQKSGLPDADWVVNPYTGCRFACKYCYAAFVGRFRHPDEEWGSYVDVKTNAPELLRKRLKNCLTLGVTPFKGVTPLNIGSILFSSVTDPYQGLEAKYKLTRRCLEVLAELNYEGKVGILTKSSLVVRDIDVLKKLKNVSVGLTITSTGDPISKYLETFASPHETRIETLKKLHAAGIKTYAFVGPLLPHFVFMKGAMESLLRDLKKTGVSFIYLEHINLSPYIRDRLFKYVKKDYPSELEKFKKAQALPYRQKLDEMLMAMTNRIGLSVAHQKPIYHQNKKSWKKIKNR